MSKKEKLALYISIFLLGGIAIFIVPRPHSAWVAIVCFLIYGLTVAFVEEARMKKKEKKEQVKDCE